jgi:hypothetical protein
MNVTKKHIVATPSDLQFETCSIDVVTLSSGSLDEIVNSAASRPYTKYLCAALKMVVRLSKVIVTDRNCDVVQLKYQTSSMFPCHVFPFHNLMFFQVKKVSSLTCPCSVQG